MRKIIYIFFALICLELNAATYYASPSGISANAGTIANPKDMQSAFELLEAGDTLYLRGGIYYAAEWYGYYYGDVYHNSGTQANPICIFNYPDETPIIDGTGQGEGSGLTRGFIIQGVSWVHLKGFEIRNILQSYEGEDISAMQVYACSNVIVENFKVHHNQGMGFEGAVNEGVGNTNVTFLNCDSYYNRDPLSDPWPYNGGDGFQLSNDDFRGSYLVKGCRSWNNADDGYDCYWNDGIVVFDSCWAMNNGYTATGDGDGFKLGMTTISAWSGVVQREVRNCVSIGNSYRGFDGNHAVCQMEIYNNLSIYNITKYEDKTGTGFGNYGDNGETGEIYRNNIAYGNSLDNDLRETVSSSYNSWDGVGIVSDADFLSLDSASLSGNRQADGSLPITDFGRLFSSSDLINAGTNVGLPYSGTAPDLGWSEYTPGPQIIADHSIVADYDKIPERYMDSVKTMLVYFPGESHVAAYRGGLALLEGIDADYAVNLNGSIESATDQYLRVWDYAMYEGESRWFTWYAYPEGSRPSEATMYKNLIAAQSSNPISLFGFGWCNDMTDGLPTSSIDPVYGMHWFGESVGGPDGDLAWGVDAEDSALTGNDVNLTTYLNATEDYRTFCLTNGYITKIAFTTGPVDYAGVGLEAGYQATIKHDLIRDFVEEDSSRILFDYADILCYDDDGSLTTSTIAGYTFQSITPTNKGNESIGHISQAGAIRLAKAQWWTLARIAGWDGGVSIFNEQIIDSTLTDILGFTLPTETGAATINTTNHTVAIEVSHLATVTNLTPYISLSYGATISPESMTSRDFTTPQTYTVTALNGTTTQEWTVTVTQAEAPARGVLVKFGNRTLLDGNKVIRLN